MNPVFARIRTVALLICVSMGARAALASPPQVFHTANYQAPVRGAPDDLLMIAGYGFSASDRVVYQAAGGSPAPHPAGIPGESTADVGVAPIVQVADPAYAITVRLPAALIPNKIYRLWVVNHGGEWSEPVTLNDPRPLWITPAYSYERVDFAGLGREVRVVGRNLQPVRPAGPDGSATVWVRLRGLRPAQGLHPAKGPRSAPGPATFTLKSTPQNDARLAELVAAATLPAQMPPGQYVVGLSRDGQQWLEIADQPLQIRPDPPRRPRFNLDAAEFGGCAPDDHADDWNCLERAVQAAAAAGGGVVVVPAGTWDFDAAHPPAEFAGPHRGPGDGVVLPPGVDLEGAGAARSMLVRHHSPGSTPGGALLTLTGHNTISGLGFTDADPYRNGSQTRPVLQLGTLTGMTPSELASAPAIDDVVISANTFLRVGQAIFSGGLPLQHLFITHNDFGAYDNALMMTGSRHLPVRFRIDDAVIRANRFFPGSFLDLRDGSGTIATQLGASRRVDFSANVGDGASTAGLQSPEDPTGWRAGFFWNTSDNHEFLLISQNLLSCPGDKVNAGEAIVLDDNANTPAFNGAVTVLASGPDWVTVSGRLLDQQDGRSVPVGTFYLHHWLTAVQGPGLGQARRIVSYDVDAAKGTVRFSVQPAWDVRPQAGTTRMGVTRQYWHVYTVANEIEQRTPPCQKSNLSGHWGGPIGYVAPTADSVISGNRQYDTSGIVFQQVYSIRSPACKECGTALIFQSGLEIRGNTVEGEYAWDSDCSDSGIAGSFAASPTPESPPPVLSLGVTIADNLISHADGLGGGGIDMVATWYRGPPPHDWAFVQNLLVYGNTLRDISGPLPAASCRRGVKARVGIRLQGPGSVRDAVLYNNRCERVDVPVQDEGVRTVRLASTSGGQAEESSSCNVSAVQRAP